MIENLKDAISHCKEVAEINRKEAEELREYGEHVSPPNQPYNIPVKACLECANEHEQLAAWLTELQERRETDRWIPVSERLPEEYGNYLVFTSDNDTDIGTFNPRFEDSWSMCDANGFYWVRQKGIEITHWKPLPKAPESEADK